MVSTPAAEWLIARFTNADAASSMMGDLLEEATERGAFWFWLSVAGIVLSFSWRPLVAFASGFACLSLLRRLPMPVYAPLHGTPSTLQPSESWWSFFAGLGGLAMLLWVVPPFLMVCYGFRDRFAQLALAVSVLITTADVCWRQPTVVVACIAVATAILVGSAVTVPRRGPLLALVVTAFVGYAGFQGANYLAWRFLNFAPPSVNLTVCVNDLVPAFAAATLTIASGYLHSFLMPPDAPGADTGLGA
jgi:hypothetical protein